MSILNITLWQAPPLKENIEAVERRAKRRGRRKASRWRSPAAPVDIYCYLKARFGKPNGIIMITAPPSSDNIFHWHYTLRSGDEELHIQGVSSRVDFLAHANSVIDEPAWNNLLAAIKANFREHGESMKEIRRSLERWTIFVNPYFRLERMVADFHARLVDLDLDSNSLPEFPERAREFKAFQRIVKNLGDRYTEAAELGMALRMITPVWAESFINLIIFLLAKSEVRANSRLYDDLLRKEIDVRIASLCLHCDGFLRPLNRESEEVRDLLRVMNARNDLLHGNVDPKKLAIGEIFFEGRMPLFIRHQTMTERAFAPKVKHLERDSVIKDIYRVEAFIAYVLDQLTPEFKKSVQLFMEDEIPGWRADTGRPGILFGDIFDYSISLPTPRSRSNARRARSV